MHTGPLSLTHRQYTFDPNVSRCSIVLFLQIFILKWYISSTHWDSLLFFQCGLYMLKFYWELLYLFCMYTWPRLFLWYNLIFFPVMFYRPTYKNSGFYSLSLFLCHPPELFVSSPKDCQVFLSYSILKAEVKFLVNLTPQLKISWRLFSSETKRKKIPDYQKEFLMLNMKHPADNVCQGCWKVIWKRK